MVAMTRVGVALVAAVLLLQGCAGLQDRRATRDRLLEGAGWRASLITTAQFDIAAAEPLAPRRGDTLTVYLEGDGRAYLNASLASSDPTPRDPTALRMALAAPHPGPLLYLARPCQYTMPGGRNCEKKYWTGERYAPPIVESLNEALQLEKHRVGASRLILVGYSGGGALAVLLAARRNDVVSIVTVAANLDLDYWVGRDGLTPLDGSLDPAAYAADVRQVPQIHMVGGRDRVVGPDVAQSFLRKSGINDERRLMLIPAFDHVCCWAENWLSLSRSAELAGILKPLADDTKP